LQRRGESNQRTFTSSEGGGGEEKKFHRPEQKEKGRKIKRKKKKIERGIKYEGEEEAGTKPQKKKTGLCDMRKR